MIEHSLCLCTRLCAKYLILIISTFHTLKAEYYYLYSTEKKTGILRGEKLHDSHRWQAVDPCAKPDVSVWVLQEAKLQREFNYRYS